MWTYPLHQVCLKPPYTLCVETKGKRSMLCAGSSDQKTGLLCAVIHVEVLGRECSFSPKKDKQMPCVPLSAVLGHRLPAHWEARRNKVCLTPLLSAVVMP